MSKLQAFESSGLQAFVDSGLQARGPQLRCNTCGGSVSKSYIITASGFPAASCNFDIFNGSFAVQNHQTSFPDEGPAANPCEWSLNITTGQVLQPPDFANTIPPFSQVIFLDMGTASTILFITTGSSGMLGFVRFRAFGPFTCNPQDDTFTFELCDGVGCGGALLCTDAQNNGVVTVDLA